MDVNARLLAGKLLPCPHCGKAPDVVVVVSQDDDAAKWLDVSFLRQIRLGRPYCRIECCAVMEGNEGWEEMAAVWNKRIAPCFVEKREGREEAGAVSASI